MFLNISQQNRPNRITDVKDETYHVNFARWGAYATQHPLYQGFIAKSNVNWEFYKGNQWIFDEDLANFFMDAGNNERHRVKFTQDIIQPTVNALLSRVMQMKFNSTARNISEFASNRREKALARLLFYTQLAQQGGAMGQMIQQAMPIGQTPAETEEIFENEYVDKLTEKMNMLLDYIENINDFDNIKNQLALQLALTGLCVAKVYERNKELITDFIDSRYFIRDMNARKSDLTDSEFMGEYSLVTAPYILENWQDLDITEKKAIENYNINNTNNVFTDGSIYYQKKLPLVEMYWQDIERFEYGWVKDEYGYEFFTRVNYKGDNDKPRYTDKDLIKSKSNLYQDVLKGKLKTKITTDILRYCIFIPKEVLSNNNGNDIVLEYGIYEWQEKDPYKPQSIDYPYKPQAWIYDMGEIISPIDCIISPQRFMNRLLSIGENQINHSGGKGIVYDIHGVDDENELLSRMARNEPIGIDASRVGGVQNAVAPYDNNIGAGTMNIFNIVRIVGELAQNNTGVNEAMLGTLSRPDQQLVGVMQAQMQSGALLQENFFECITRSMERTYQCVGRLAKDIYSKYERKLALSVGDDGVSIIQGLNELELEDFHIMIKREIGDISLKEQANFLLMNLLQVQLIDAKVYANLFNRATPDMIARELRRYQSQLAEAKRNLEAQQAQAQQTQAQAIQEAQYQQQETGRMLMEREDRKDLEKQQHDIDKTLVRGQVQARNLLLKGEMDAVKGK